MQRKIFIGINIDDKTKRFIDNKLSDLKAQLPMKWTSLENYHITMHFAGYIEDEEIERVIMRLRDALEKVEIFDIIFDNISWGPSSEKPKMIWLKGGKNLQLIELRQTIESAVSDSTAKAKEFKPHITLGRLDRGVKKKDLPDVKQSARVLVPVTSVDVMESVVEKRKRKYLLMESIELS